MKTLVPVITGLILFCTLLISCERTYNLSDQSIGTVYKIGYYNGVRAARKCVIEKTIQKDKYMITYYEYADTLFILDSLNFQKSIK